MNFAALIAEDEPLLARALQDELAVLWPELDVIAVAPNGLEAQRQLLAHAPDIAFLDVRMPGASGIEVAQAIAEDWPEATQPPLLVFVTAYEQFAVAAFSHAAVDYILKPVQPLRLQQTVQRLKQRLAERASGLAEFDARSELEQLAARMRQLLGNGLPAGVPLPEGPEPLRVIRAGVGDTVRLIRLAEVLYLQATDKYVSVVAADGEALIREPLRELLPRLDPERFVQIHRGTVVNLDCVESASRDGSGKLCLKIRGRDERLTVSRLYAQLFKPM